VPAGSHCNTTVDCVPSSTCVVGPENLNYCRYNNYQCAKPNAYGARATELYNFNLKDYRCNADGTLNNIVINDGTIQPGELCAENNDCVQGSVCSPGPDSIKYCKVSSYTCAKPQAPGVNVNETYNFGNYKWTCTSGGTVFGTRLNL
jgi:hypothetical protein